MDKIHNAKSLCRPPIPLFKISINDLGPTHKIVSPQSHVMIDDKLDTVQAPAPNVKITDTMNRLLKKIALNTMKPSETNTHVFFLTGEQIYTLINFQQTSKHVKNLCNEHHLDRL
jgi:hypothetical protein